jgi:two-component system phosphate regulon sensor histidine kinase PhoR
MSQDAILTVAALPMPAILIGPDERIEALNSAARTLFGHDGTGRHYITVLRQPGTLEAIEKTLSDRNPREGRYLGREGSRDTTWRTFTRPLSLPSGPRVLVSFEDITAVEEAGQIRRDFVANVSHELRTPLTALLGFVETLQGPARDDPKARDRFLGIIAGEASRMARLVDDLLNLSRVEAEERQRPVGRVDVAELAASAASTLEPLAARWNTAIRVEAPDRGATVLGDAGQLRQMLLNLMENAVKYGGTGGPVDVTVMPPQDEPSLRRRCIRVIIADRGPGIAAHHIPRLTERFYRVDTHRSREIGGTGLGLAIVKHVINRHRGRLRIESEPGQGSRFIVILPTD